MICKAKIYDKIMWNRVEFGEIVCLDKRGRPQFNDLLFHRGEPCFFAFDLLMNDGRDLRTERLTDRKHERRRVLSKVPTSRMRYVEHVEQHGTALFDASVRWTRNELSPSTALEITPPKHLNRQNSDLLEPGSGKPGLQWRVYVPAASSNSSPKQP